MKNKVTKNYLYNFAYQILSFVTPIITSPYLARTLGSESIGINNYTYSIVYWFILFGMMGISVYGSKEVAKVSDDKQKISQKFSEIFSLQFLNLCISSILFYIIFVIFNFEYKSAFLLQGLMIISSMLDISWLFNGLEDFKKITTRNFVVKILTVLLMLLLIKKPSQYMLHIGISVGMSFFSNIVMWINVKKYLNFKIPKIKNIYKHLKETIILFLPQIATTIYSMFDQTMIGWLYKDVSEVAFYNQAHKFINMFLFVTTTIGTVMLPRIVKCREKEGDAKVKRLTNQTLKIALFLSLPISLGIFSVSRYFIPWFLTEEFTKVGNIMCVLSPVIIFISITNVFGTQYMIATNKYKHYTLSVTIGCIINLILNGLTISKFGAYGASIATVITELFVLIYQYTIIKKEFDFNGIKKILLKYFICSTIMATTVILIGEKFGATILTNIIQIFVGASIYIGVLFIIKDEILLFFMNKILTLTHLKKED